MTELWANGRPTADLRIFLIIRVAFAIIALNITPAYCQITPYPLPGANLDQATSTYGGASPTWPAQGQSAYAMNAQISGATTQFLGGLSATVPGCSDVYQLGTGAYVSLVLPTGSTVKTTSATGYTVTTDQSVVAGGITRRHLYYVVGPKAGPRTITVTTDIYPAQGGCIRVDVYSSDPYIDRICFGTISCSSAQQPVAIPYYGQVDYAAADQLYNNEIIDYKVSAAATINLTSNLAEYTPLTNGARNTVSETVYYSVSPDIHSVLPSAPNPVSTYKSLMANKIVYDVWGGNFTDNANYLREFAAYNLTNVATIGHNWQNAGYDNALPDVLPANPSLGGNAGMQTWAGTALGLGELFGLHQNYCDFYPDSPMFDINDVACAASGLPIMSWSDSLGLQSYAMAPSAIAKYSVPIISQIYNLFGTNMGFIDGTSAAPPWYHVDFRSDTAGAGEFATPLNANAALYQTVRATCGGPALGEGGNQWYWSGLIDGTEADIRIGDNVGTVPAVHGQLAPLFVDFDLLHMHPLATDYGMGYFSDWIDPSTIMLPNTLPGQHIMDEYRMQEIAYGHIGMVGDPYAHSLPFFWQEHNLVSPVSSQYENAMPSRIRYDVNGTLTDTNAALAAIGENAFDRVRVDYDDGVSVEANERSSTWPASVLGATNTLPQYGWLAKGPSLYAYTAIQQGVTVDYAQTPTSLFADTRLTIPAELGTEITASIAAFSQTAPRTFQISMNWKTSLNPIPAGYVPFVHVVDMQTGKLLFQIHLNGLAAPTSWKLGSTTNSGLVAVTLPTTLADGIYDIRVGLWNPTNNARMAMDGMDDTTLRYSVGRLAVSSGGNIISDDAMIEFGAVQTDGSFELTKVSTGVWSLMPFPQGRILNIVMSGTQVDSHWITLKVQALDVSGYRLGAIPVSITSNGRFSFQLNATPNAVSYLLTP